LAADITVVYGLDRTPLVVLDPAAFAHPCGARAREPLLDVDRHVGIGIGAGGVVNWNRRLRGGPGERDLAHRPAQRGPRLRARREAGRGRVVTLGVGMLGSWMFIVLLPVRIRGSSRKSRAPRRSPARQCWRRRGSSGLRGTSVRRPRSTAAR